MILCSLDYVEEMFNTFIDGKLNKKLTAARKELETDTCSNEHHAREEATEAWRKRKAMVVQEDPRTIQGTA